MIVLLMKSIMIFLTIDLALIIFIIVRKLILTYIRKQRIISREKYDPIIVTVLTTQDLSPLRKVKLNRFDKAVIQHLLVDIIEKTNYPYFKFVEEIAYAIGVYKKNIKRLKGIYWWDQAQAVHLLGLFRMKEAIPNILHTLERTNNREVILKCCEALLMISGVEYIELVIEKLIAIENQSIKQITDLMLLVDDDYFERLERLSRDNDEAKKVFLEASSMRGDVRIISYIKEGMYDENIEIMISSLKASSNLGGIQDEQYYRTLLEISGHKFWVVRAFTAKVLAFYNQMSSTDALKDLLRDSNWRVRNNAGEALLYMGSNGMVALADMLDDDDRFARDMSWQVLQTAQLRENFSELKQTPNAYNHVLKKMKAYTERKYDASLSNLEKNSIIL